MNHYLGSAWTAARLAVLAVATALLAGCMIVSESELVADSEGAQVLPAKAYLTGYDEDGPNTWKVSDDGASGDDAQRQHLQERRRRDQRALRAAREPAGTLSARHRVAGWLALRRRDLQERHPRPRHDPRRPQRAGHGEGLGRSGARDARRRRRARRAASWSQPRAARRADAALSRREARADESRDVHDRGRWGSRSRRGSSTSMASIARNSDPRHRRRF